MFYARRCRHQIEKVSVRQVHRPLDVDVYSAEIVKDRTRKDVMQGKSVTRLLVQIEIDGIPDLGSNVQELKMGEGVG